MISIDPALRNTGYALIERTERPGRKPHYRAVEYGTIKNSPRLLQSGCLLAIREKVGDMIVKHSPEICAVEGVIYVQSYRTAITMGAARGAAILAAAEHGLQIYEYAPRRVKQAVVGRGGADKQQVAFMIRALLSLEETPDSDAADALAIGLAHFYASEPGRPQMKPDQNGPI